MTTLIEEARGLGNLQAAADSNTVMRFLEEKQKDLK